MCSRCSNSYTANLLLVQRSSYSLRLARGPSSLVGVAEVDVVAEHNQPTIGTTNSVAARCFGHEIRNSYSPMAVKQCTGIGGGSQGATALSFRLAQPESCAAQGGLRPTKEDRPRRAPSNQGGRLDSGSVVKSTRVGSIRVKYCSPFWKNQRKDAESQIMDSEPLSQRPRRAAQGGPFTNSYTGLYAHRKR